MPATCSICRHLFAPAIGTTVKRTLVQSACTSVFCMCILSACTQICTQICRLHLFRHGKHSLTALTIADSSPLLCQYFFTPYLLANRGQKFCNNGMNTVYQTTVMLTIHETVWTPVPQSTSMHHGIQNLLLKSPCDVKQPSFIQIEPTKCNQTLASHAGHTLYKRWLRWFA